MELSFKNIIIMVEGKDSPIYLSNILTQNYYENYFNSFDIKASVLEFIEEFYQLHYDGKKISSDTIELISETFAFDFSLVITCIYLLEIRDKGQFLELCTENLNELYEIIKKTHDSICPNNRKSSHYFSEVDKSEVLFITGINKERNSQLNSESFIKINELSKEDANKRLVTMVSDDIIKHIKESIDETSILKSLLGYILLMDTINNYEGAAIRKLKNYLIDNSCNMNNFNMKMIFLEAAIIAKDKIWVLK